uniref:Uncharacterized protein n=1 Tax=Cacopsylla melanoneura TaxID=428564 RepID=A0A8D8V6C2_9HEMI
MPIKINFMSPAANRTRDLCVRVLSQFDTHKAMRAVTSILCRLPCQCQYRTNTSTGDNIYNNNILYFGLRIRCGVNMAIIHVLCETSVVYKWMKQSMTRKINNKKIKSNS